MNYNTTIIIREPSPNQPLILFRHVPPPTHTASNLFSTLRGAIIFLNLYAYLYIQVDKYFFKFKMVYVPGATQTRTCNMDNQ